MLEEQTSDMLNLTEQMNALRTELDNAREKIRCHDALTTETSTNLEVLREAHNAALEKVVETEKRLIAAQHQVEETEKRAAIQVQEITSHLAYVEATVREREEEIARTLTEHEAQLQASRHEMHRLTEETNAEAADRVRSMTDQLANMNSTLRQREEEIEQTIVQYNIAVQRQRDFEIEKTRSDKLREEAERWVFNLAKERQMSNVAIARFEKEAIYARTSLQKFKDKIVDLENRLHHSPSKDAFITLQSENLSLKAIIEESLHKVSSLENTRDDLKASLDALYIINQPSFTFDSSSGDISTFNAQNNIANPDFIESTRLIEMEERLEEQFGEITALSRLLIIEQQRAEYFDRQLDWLRQITPTVMRRKWWFRLVTKNRISRYIHAKLLEKNLFDAAEYIARYPDVSQEGVDPLEHYIIHGIDESRIWIKTSS
jgi:hypothetical protein